MRKVPGWKRLFRLEETRGHLHDGVDEEMRFHIESRVEQLVEAGLSEEEARAEAERLFGELEDYRRACQRLEDQSLRMRKQREYVRTLLRDSRLAFRGFVRDPIFSITVVLILAVVIGANSAAFSFINTFLLQPPPVESPGQLVRVFPNWEGGIQYGMFAFPEYLDLRDRNTVFSDLLVESPTPLSLSVDGRNERIWGSVVSGNYFSGLGVEPLLGRGFPPGEDLTVSGPPVVVLSYGLWRSYFGSDPGVIGRAILLNGHPFTVAGVMPRRFRGVNIGYEPQLWAPAAMRRELIPGRAYLDSRGGRWILYTIGRLKPGVSIEQAEAGCNAVLAQLGEEHPEIYKTPGQRYRLYPEAKAGLHPEIRGSFSMGLGALSAVVGILLLLACANVAGLLLSRSAARQSEIGIRLALGASRFSLVRQLLTESIILSLVAGALGIFLGYCLALLLQSFQPPIDFPLRFRAGLDTYTLVFTLLISILTGIVFGLAPAMYSSRQDIMPVLKDGGSMQSRGGLRLRKTLVVSQVAVSMGLLIIAGMVFRSLQNVGKVDPGFDPRGQVIASVDLNLQGYDEAAGREFFRSLKGRIDNLPGVESSGFGKILPLSIDTRRTGFRPDNFEVTPDFRHPAVEYNITDSGYFSAMRIPVVGGRIFSREEEDQPFRVVVINETLARFYWPGENPVGKTAWIGIGGEGFEVIGVVRDGKYTSLAEAPRPGMYLPTGRFYSGDMNLHLRTAGSGSELLETVGRVIAELDKTLPVHNLKTMEEHLAFTMLPARMAAGAVSSFALLALILAATGLYGVVACFVSQTRREIGIRMALGAGSLELLRMVVGRGLGLTAAGLMIGLVAGLLASRLVVSMLYGVSPTDPVSFALGILILLVTALLACFIPVLEAFRVDPVNALRVE